MKINFNPFNIATVIIGVSMSTTQLSGCHSADLLGMPRVSVENHMGDSQIAKILDEAYVYTGASIYHDHPANEHIRDENTELYKTILTTINNAKQKPVPLNEALNNSNLGVVCTNDQCQYYGYYLKHVLNVPDGNVTLKTDVHVVFDPNRLKQTYNVTITSTKLPSE